jgi:hypothetical protein
VIKISIIPIRWIVTRCAVSAELSVVLVILPVARKTILRRALEHSIYVAGFTRHLSMFPHKLERCQVMIECRWRPAILCMTVHAGESKTSIMRLVGMVTGVAILWRHGEIAKSARSVMTLVAGKPRVFPFQLERKNTVIKILIEAIHTIVTIDTGCTERQVVSDHKSHVLLTMTGIACIGMERGNVVGVAIGTGERFTRSRKLVTV